MRDRDEGQSEVKRHASALGIIALVLALTACSSGRDRPGAVTVTGGAPMLNTAELFADQGPLYDSNLEPGATDAVTLTLRTAHDNVRFTNIEYYDMGYGAHHYVPMRVAAIDPTGRFDEWRGTIPAGAAPKRYRFQIRNGSQTVWYNAGGGQHHSASARGFLDHSGIQDADWMKTV